MLQLWQAMAAIFLPQHLRTWLEEVPTVNCCGNYMLNVKVGGKVSSSQIACSEVDFHYDLSYTQNEFENW